LATAVLTLVGFADRATAAESASVASGGSHSCAILTSGGVVCWGLNSAGQLGNGSTTNSSTPVAVSGLSAGVASIAIGGDTSCAVLTSGAIKCWGDDSNGQLGDGSPSTNSSTPVSVSGITTGVLVDVSLTHTCAVITGGAVTCWGSGIGAAPVALAGISSGATDVTVGLYHSCAVVVGAVKCWGNNGWGQLGNNTTSSSGTTPVTAVASGGTAVTAGGEFTCAVVSGGAKCWGLNMVGELGNGSTTNSSTPVAVSGLSAGVASISTGSLHTCALLIGGALKCWGSNSRGQLGNGSTTNATTATDVSGIPSGAISLGVGNSQACAVLTGGTMKCWGRNDVGQLGDGSTANSSVPVFVSGFGSSISPPSSDTSTTTTATGATSAAATTLPALPGKGPCTRKRCTTKGQVPVGTTSVTQWATLMAVRKSAVIGKRVSGTCKISKGKKPKGKAKGKGKKAGYTCKIRLTKGTWSITTQAKAGSVVVAQTVTTRKVK
jgi:alpha-tubulin suppressor-like RCC1 family protein